MSSAFIILRKTESVVAAQCLEALGVGDLLCLDVLHAEGEDEEARKGKDRCVLGQDAPGSERNLRS